MWGVFVIIGLFAAIIGGAMIGVGKKKNLDVEIYIIGGSVILAGGIALFIGGLISSHWHLSTGYAILSLITLLLTCAGATLAAIAKKRVDNKEGPDNDQKMYKEKWMPAGIALAVVSGLVLILSMWNGISHSTTSGPGNITLT
jgi:hypothetical protein